MKQDFILGVSTGGVRRTVSRDYVSGACDAMTEDSPRTLVDHDFAGRHISQTIRERKALASVNPQRPQYAADDYAHFRRVLRTEFHGGLVLGLVFGAFFTTLSLALSYPWWAPLVVWMVRP